MEIGKEKMDKQRQPCHIASSHVSAPIFHFHFSIFAFLIALFYFSAA